MIFNFFLLTDILIFQHEKEKERGRRMKSAESPQHNNHRQLFNNHQSAANNRSNSANDSGEFNSGGSGTNSAAGTGNSKSSGVNSSGGKRDRRIMYDSTGPNDSRYYVGKSSFQLFIVSNP